MEAKCATMSKSLEQSAAELERKAQDKAVIIRRVMREYNTSQERATGGDSLYLLRKEREIDRAVADYIRLYKAIRRVRKKLRAHK